MASQYSFVEVGRRHAAESTVQRRGTAQVAEWAGHSMEVLLRTYAKCIVGQDELARRRIKEALNPDDQGDGAT